MSISINSEQELKDFLINGLKNCCSEAVILFHNQRKTVLKILKEVAEKTGKDLIEKDLMEFPENKLNTHIFKDKIPDWLLPIFNKINPNGYILYLREFALAADNVKNDIMNMILKREIEGQKFPENTFIILGVLDVDGVAGSLSNVKSIIFYKKID